MMGDEVTNLCMKLYPASRPMFGQKHSNATTIEPDQYDNHAAQFSVRGLYET